eukprot:TRINITY_DN83767_c0_g1_i1.p1 TRINITY_DN83767_c0_g1~~TRINITY_DN83767_c0_g1_i1.p1  ORF type:complete len:296 (-),score=47.37 TRINITY_DN83767_c0_g1_i1:34-921(-)
MGPHMETETLEFDNTTSDRGQSPGGLAAVRAHLADVSKDLQEIQEQFSGSGTRGISLDLQSVERFVRHLEVDRQELIQRCQNLMREKQDMQKSYDNLEAELYSTRQDLEEAKRQLRHQAIDLKTAGAGASEDYDKVTLESLEALQSLSGSERQRQMDAMSKLQLCKALRSAQDAIVEEQRHCEKLERQQRKDQAHIVALEDKFERQYQEINMIRRKKQTRMSGVPASVSAKTKQLHYLEHTAPVIRPLQGPAAIGVPEPAPPPSPDHPLMLPAGLQRSKSLPNKLPKMRGNCVSI